MSQTTLTLEEIRTQRLTQEADYYKSDLGFVDFVRDCGAAPDAEYQPHGRYAQELTHWNGRPDKDNPQLIHYMWKLVLWPRSSFKTQVFVIGHICWLIARDPNRRILLTSETDTLSSDIVAKIMDIVDSKWFRDRFGTHRSKGSWKTGSFTSALRTDIGAKEPTLQAGSVGTVMTGFHWTDVFMDDVCSQKNTQNLEGIDKLWNWFGETLAQLDPGSRLFVVGTLHHFADIYCKIMKEPDIRKLFEISVKAWSDPVIDPTSTATAELFFPSRLTRTFVASRKATMTPRLFACFYENQPFSGEDQCFKKEYFRVIEDEHIPNAVWTYLFTDWAFVADQKQDRHDRTAFWIVSLDANRTAYVRDFYVGRWKPSDSVQIACDLWTRYQVLNMKAIGVEETTYNELLKSLFEMMRRQTLVMPRFIDIGGRSQQIKDMRIEAAEPRWRAGDIYFARSLRQQFNQKWKPMFEEMTEWPASDHDDIPDAISDIDKVDKHGRLYFPGPPPDWSPMVVRRFVPPIIDGRYNPDYKQTAQERVKQHGNQAWDFKPLDQMAKDDLFKETALRRPSSDDIFGKR